MPTTLKTLLSTVLLQHESENGVVGVVSGTVVVVVGGGREEDMRAPRHVVGLVEEPGLGRDEVALQFDAQAGLL